MLELKNVHTYYGESHILDGVSFVVEDGAVLALVGRNGMGKTTIIRSIIGFTPPRNGEVLLGGLNICGKSPEIISKLGVGLVPQGRRIFHSLTVLENIVFSARKKPNDGGWTLDKIFELFPVLLKKSHSNGNQLSGGEQQMLAIARALMTNPRILLMDEPTEGLAPVAIYEVARIIAEIKESKQSTLLVEQSLSFAIEVSDFIHVIKKGQVVYGCLPDEIRGDEGAAEKLLWM
ncbi:MAG: ABC transporter ATP-binding protein [Desulfobacteraceae bacterium]|nr:MAG: ABC transporter ATP-binding protein [Desulfobacteraceae bacterium]